MPPKREPTGWNFIRSRTLRLMQEVRRMLSVLSWRQHGRLAVWGLGLNAGHDLSLENLKYMHEQIGWIDEVSIGHALICDALYLGLEETVKRYLECLK